MPLSTDFDKLVTNNGKADEEKKPFVFSRLHGVPKQIADSSNAIGVNEKTLKNGLMSGVMQPSQIAHDRWLSIFDGFMDSLFFFILMVVCSSLDFNIYMIPMFILTYLYMFFHFVWWEHAMQWYFIETIIEYLDNTRRYYYATLIVCSLLFSTAGYYYMQSINIDDKIELVREKLSIINEVTSGVSNISTSSKLNPNSPFQKNENEFSTSKKTMEIPTTNIRDINKKIETKSTEKQSDKNKINTIMTFIVLNLFHIIIMYFTFKYSKKLYEIKRNKNLDSVEVELKSELEQKMFMLREKM